MFKHCTLNCTCVPVASWPSLSFSSPRYTATLPSPPIPTTSVLPRRLRTLSTQASYVLLSAGTAYNENIVLVELVMPQYRIMYNYITSQRRRSEKQASKQTMKWREPVKQERVTRTDIKTKKATSFRWYDSTIVCRQDLDNPIHLDYAHMEYFTA